MKSYQTLFGYLACLLIAVGGTACEKDELNTDDGARVSNMRTLLNQSTTTFRTVPRENDTLQLVEINESLDSLVIMLSRYVDYYPSTIDDEVDYQLLITLPADAESFDWADEELVANKVVIRFECFCISGEFYAITEGSISGTKLSSGSWSLAGSIVVPEEIAEVFAGDVGGIYSVP